MPERARDVEQVVREWLDAKQSGDAAAISRRLSAYKGVLAVGTDAGERWSGVDRFSEAHTAGGPFNASVKALEAHAHGPVAWAAVDATVHGDGGDDLNIRLTLVLIEELDGWRVVQSHASMPAG
jgi:ketosteroid isomerase-like protein